MPKTSHGDVEELHKQLEELSELRATARPELQGWATAMKLLNAMDIDGAARAAAAACNTGLADDKIAGMILHAISNIAVINMVISPGIEAMWTSAAEFGHHDLAYNAANQTMAVATSPADYKMAARYYQRAIERCENNATKASALTNYAEIVREGLITGEKDWHGAVRLYEQAAEYGLVKAMFNAGNVLLWIVESGDKSYGARAAEWFAKVIDHVETGKVIIDFGGAEECVDVLRSAKIRLAGMHLNKTAPRPRYASAIKLLRPYLDGDGYALEMLADYNEGALVRNRMIPRGNAGANWAQVLSGLGWKILNSYPFDVGKVGGIAVRGVAMDIKTKDEWAPMHIIALNSFSHPDLAGSWALRVLGQKVAEDLGRTVFTVGTKGFFVESPQGCTSILHWESPTASGFVPIWPGATADDVVAQLDRPQSQLFKPWTTDRYNTIPILVNALDEGITLDQNQIPTAIWVGADSILRYPILRATEPSRHGLQTGLSEGRLQEILDETHRQHE